MDAIGDNFDKDISNEGNESDGAEAIEADGISCDEKEESTIQEEIGEDIDFTKSIPQEDLMRDIHSYAPAELEPDCLDCDDHHVNDEDDADFFDDGVKSTKKKEKLGSKRVVALIVIFPMLASGLFMLYEIFGRFKFEKSAMQFTAAIGGAVIALFIMSNIAALRSAVKFVLAFSWIIFLYPTYQVYKCSPVPLKNDMLGTWFSLKTEASRFSEMSYVTSECFQSFQFHSPYMLSLLSVKVSLTVDISDLINLNSGGDEIDINEENIYHYFLFVSKRSVKKKFHKLHMIAQAAPKLALTLKESLKLSASEREKQLLLITGGVVDISDPLLPMKKELEGYGYLIRPVIFKVYNVKYVDRYAKLKRNYEGYY